MVASNPDQKIAVPSSGYLAPDGEDIIAQLNRIVSSQGFPKAGRSVAFLTYIVEETLAGRGQRIKGYTIAIEVFKRSEGFTQDDPVVRIEAGRLRRTLEHYYLIAGVKDPVRINIPKGAYVPIFSWNISPVADNPSEPFEVEDRVLPGSKRSWFQAKRALLIYAGALIFTVCITYMATSHFSPNVPASDVSIPDQPTLVVAPFANLGDGLKAELYARGLTEELLTALPRFKEIKVFGRETSKSLAPEVDTFQVRKGLGAHFLLTGGLRISDNKVRVTARLLDTSNEAILWSQTYDNDLGTRELFAIQSDVANKVATAVAQPYGIIAQANASRPPPDDLDAYGCTLSYYAYRADMGPESHAKVRSCLESAVAHYPNYATAWAMLAIIYLDEDRFHFNQGTGTPSSVTRALTAVETAVHLDPNDIRAQQALMTTLYFNQRLDDALKVGWQALATNPNDTELMGEFGFRLALSGHWEQGAALMDKAIALNPVGAEFYYGVRALAAYMLHDNRNAVLMIRKVTTFKFPMLHIMAAAIYAEAGMAKEAKHEGDIFMKSRPDFVKNILMEFNARNIRPADQARMIASLRKAGMAIPAKVPAEDFGPRGSDPS
jgi:TolB-like protein